MGVGRVDLDNRASYQHLDPAGMLDFAHGFPAQVVEAAEIGRGFALPWVFNPRQVVLAGMGGSAAVGDFLARLSEPVSLLPMVVCRNYEIPAFVGPDTLFIACSHSGDTEETLAAATAAKRRGARIVCITTDGKLQRFARRHRKDGVVLLQIPRADPPMPPRAALGYLFIPLVCLFGSLGLCSGVDQGMREVVPLLERLRASAGPGVRTARNRAKRLATHLFGKIPWIQGTAGIMSAVAYRWRCQFNENSKALAYSGEYPELNHNEVVGWELAEGLGERIEVVVLRSPGDHWRNRARVDITKRKLIGRKANVGVIDARGETPLAQLLWMTYLGDFTSLYLAFLNGVNPASTDSIGVLKRDLARLGRPRQLR